MDAKNKSYNLNNKAQAMVVVFVYVSVVSLLAIYIMTFAANMHNVVVREINHSRAFYAGEAGLVASLVDCDMFYAYGVGADPNGKVLQFPVVTGGNLLTVRIDTAAAGSGRMVRATVSNWRR